MEDYKIPKSKKLYIITKQIFDIFISAIGLIVLSPVFIIIAAAIKLDSKGPVFFRQKRVGINKSYFMIHKFRTMYMDAPKDVPTHLMQNSNTQITRVGRILRKTSLDELPQLLDVLSGKLSLVGPRPALWNQDDLIVERDKHCANSVKPGITGWAQINGRDELEIPVKAALDGYYVKHLGYRIDLACLFGTFLAVVKRKGVVEGGEQRPIR